MSNRILPVVYNDRESEARTPSRPLIVIPRAAQDPFSAMPPLPAIHPHEADFTRIAPGRPQAAGQPILVTGRVLDEDERPVRRSLIEMWNANTHGRYSHTGDSNSPQPLDPNFYGFGRLLTDDEGVYRLRTVKPGAYLARADIGWWRPPHVHFSILGCGVRLVTQMYFPGEPLNHKDYIHMTIPEPERPLVIATMAEPHTYRFDIVVRGRFQNSFAEM
jgi:protocatechuate 3,4-dioxygenase beta subunit